MTDESRRERWESRTEWPLTVLALTLVIVYAWPILDPNLSTGAVRVCEALAWFTWAVFAIDYVVRVVLSPDRRQFVRANLFDLLMVALPLLRPLRLLRLVTVLAVIDRKAGGSLRGRVAVYVAGSTALVVFLASLAMLEAERGEPEGNIKTFGDSVWWAAATVMTVGYGDRYPTTTNGRIVAVCLMLCGIALLGVVTAGLASWLIDRVRDVEEEPQLATRRDLEDLTAEVRALRDALAALED